MGPRYNKKGGAQDPSSMDYGQTAPQELNALTNAMPMQDPTTMVTDAMPFQDTTTLTDALQDPSSVIQDPKALAQAAVDSNPEVMAFKAAQQTLAPGLTNTVNSLTDVNNIPIDTSNISLNVADQIGYDPNKGWINGVFRSKTYFKQLAFNNILFNNRFVNNAKAVVNNAIKTTSQRLAEMLNLVKPGEDITLLNPEELDMRIGKLNDMLKDPAIKKDIEEAATSLVSAAQKPLADATKEISSLSEQLLEETGKNAALAAGNAVKIIPVAGNVISAINAVQNVTDLVNTTAESATKAVGILDDASFSTNIALKKEEITLMTKGNNPLIQPQINEKIDILNESISNEQNKIKTKIDEIDNQLVQGGIGSKETNDLTLNKTKLETKNKEYEAQKMEQVQGQEMPDISMPPMPDIPSQTGGARRIKQLATSNKSILKRVNKSIKEHLGMHTGISTKKHRARHTKKNKGNMGKQNKTNKTRVNK